MTKRYSLDFYEKPFYEDSVTIHQMVEREDGDYVKYSDYAQLAAQVEVLQAFINDVKYEHPEIELPEFMQTGQYTAEIKAQAWRDGFIAGANDATACIAKQLNAGSSRIYFDAGLAADRYTNQLRQQAKAGE